jgi:hypothetical protein
MLVIGVTGHRYLTEVGKLQTGIDQALSRIDQHFPDQDWSVLSSLAEGADRLVFERAIAYKPSTHLVVPLPLPVEEYQIDFSARSSKDEFMRWLGLADEVIQLPGVTTRERAYQLAGEYILNHIDVLVAVWDGQGAQGQGGTGEIVAMARERGLPLAWVQSGNRRTGTRIPTSLGDRQGKVIFEWI